MEDLKKTYHGFKCIKCGADLEATAEVFTGTCDYNKGQYLSFYYCPNEKCLRFKLYCEHGKVSKNNSFYFS